MLTTTTKTKAFGTTWETLLRYSGVSGPTQITLTNSGPDIVHVGINRIDNGVTVALPLIGASTTIQILPGDRFVKQIYDSPQLTQVRCHAANTRSTVTGVVVSHEPATPAPEVTDWSSQP